MSALTDANLKNYLRSLVESLDYLARRKADAQLKWIKADHWRLLAVGEGVLRSPYLDNKAAEKLDAYHAAVAAYEEAVQSSIAGLKKELAKGEGALPE